MIGNINKSSVPRVEYPKIVQDGKEQPASSKQTLKPADKEAPNQAAIKSEINAYMHKPMGEVIDEALTINTNEEGWIQKTIKTIEERLSKKYTPEELKRLDSPYVQYKSKEEVIDGVLLWYATELKHNSKNGKLTYIGMHVGLGTEEQTKKMKDFMDSLPKYGVVGRGALGLFNKTEDELDFEEFKRLYRQDMEITTKKTREQAKAINREIAEHNAKVKEQQRAKQFTPIQGKSQDNTTYDANKDPTFTHIRELLKLKQGRGIEVWEYLNLMEKKKSINVKV